MLKLSPLPFEVKSEHPTQAFCWWTSGHRDDLVVDGPLSTLQDTEQGGGWSIVNFTGLRTAIALPERYTRRKKKNLKEERN
jgi:hypothetical protein